MGATVFFESTNELATLQNTFKVGANPTDPAEVSLRIKSPTGTTTTYLYSLSQITRVSTGVYKKDIPCSEAGEWEYVWEGTVTASDATTGTWTVFPLQLGKLYATVDALKSRLGIYGNADHDYEVHLACFTASREVESYTGRVFYRSASDAVRTFEPTGMYCFEVPAFNDIVTLTTLKTDTNGDGTFDTTWSASDYQLLWDGSANPAAYPDPRPYNEVKAIGTKTFPYGYWGTLTRADRVQITGTFGWPSVPWAVKQAALFVAMDLYKSGGDEMRVGGWGEFGGRSRARTNPHLISLCRKFQRPELTFPVRKR